MLRHATASEVEGCAEGERRRRWAEAAKKAVGCAAQAKCRAYVGGSLKENEGEAPF